MKTSLSSGGFRDYIELTPDAVVEVTDILRVYMSAFVKSDLLFMDMSRPVVRLRIYVSSERPQALDAVTREELDQQS